jgi:hypothetical protein
LFESPSLLLGWDFFLSFFKNNCKKVFLLTKCLYICPSNKAKTKTNNMKNELFLELQKANLDLDRFFNISINHSNVRAMADYDTQLEQDLLKDNFVRFYCLYDNTRLDMIEYKKGNLQIVLSK